MTCLLQLVSNAGREYVIDTLAPGVWDTVGGLAPLFADPKIVKVGHSIGGLDIRCLHRDFGIFVVNAFDTYEAANALKLTQKGLAKVCASYGLSNSEMYQSLKDQYQQCDWRKRPLTKPMIQYGRYDVHYLLRLRKLMMRDLSRGEFWDCDEDSKDAEARQVATSLAAILRKMDEDDDVDGSDIDSRLSDVAGYQTPRESLYEDEFEDSRMNESDTVNGSQSRRSRVEAKYLRLNAPLMEVITRSQIRCLDLWTSKSEPHLKNAQFQSIMQRAKSNEFKFTSSQIQLYDRLFSWREQIAANEECLPGFICSLDLLAWIALKRPTSDAALRRLSFFLPELLEDPRGAQYRAKIIQMVIESRKEDGEKSFQEPAIAYYRDCLKREEIREARSSEVCASYDSRRRIVIVAGVMLAAAAAVVIVFATRKRRR